jgi:hypothetical protein
MEWLISSVGIAGIFVASGYIVQSAQESLLGIDLGTHASVGDYSLLGARFFVDVFTVVYRRLATRIWPLLVLAAAGAFAAYILAKVRSKASRTGETVLLGLLALSLGVKWVYFDLPPGQIQDVLSTRVELQRAFRGSRVVAGRAEEAWEHFFCSRAATDVFGRQCGEEPEWHEAVLENTFLINVALTTLLATLTIVTLRSAADAPERVPSAALLTRAAALAMLFVGLVALPYTYGKVIRSTRFSSVNIEFDVPSNTAASERYRAALLLSKTADDVTFWDKADDRVWEVPRAKVVRILTFHREDVVTAHMLWAQPPTNGSERNAQ